MAPSIIKRARERAGEIGLRLPLVPCKTMRAMEAFGMDKSVSLELRRIPGVGPRIAEDLWSLGCRSIQDLKNRDPEEMYRRLCEIQGKHVDRCMLYVFRCAVYFASNGVHDPELLKWWRWKDAANNKSE